MKRRGFPDFAGAQSGLRLLESLTLVQEAKSSFARTRRAHAASGPFRQAARPHVLFVMIAEVLIYVPRSPIFA